MADVALPTENTSIANRKAFNGMNAPRLTERGLDYYSAARAEEWKALKVNNQEFKIQEESVTMGAGRKVVAVML